MLEKRTALAVALSAALVLILCPASMASCARRNLDHRKISLSELVEYSTVAMSQAVLTLRRQLDAYENLTFQFAVNPDLNALLADYAGGGDANQLAIANRTFSNYLESWTFGDQAVYDALFLGEANRARKALTMSETLPAEFIGSFRDSQVHDAIVKADGKPVWFANVQVTSMGSSFVVLGRRLKYFSSGRPLGVIAILIRPECICRLIADYLAENYYFSVGTVRSSYLLIVDGRGRLISIPPNEADGPTTEANARWARACTSQLRKTLPGCANSGYFTTTLGDHDVVVMYSSVEGTDWHVFVPILPRRRQFAPPLTYVAHDPWAVATGAAAAGLVQITIIIIQRTHKRRAGAPAGCVADAPLTSGGGTYAKLPESTGSEAHAPKAQAKPAWLYMLTPREKAILFLLSQGHSNREIAERMCLAEQTVKNHLSVMYDKLGVRDRTQASLMAVGVVLSDEEMDLPEK